MGNDAGGPTGTALRNSLWNLLFRVVSSTDYAKTAWPAVLRGACLAFFREPVDDLPSDDEACRRALKERFFALPDEGVYDFFEFLLGDDRAGVKEVDRKLLRRQLNDVLEREGGGVRLLRDRFRPYADDLGFEAMAGAEESVRLFDLAAARRHLDAAHAYLMRRPEADARGAVREALLAAAAVALEVARRGAAEGETPPLLVVGSVAHAAKAAGLPDGLLRAVEAVLRRAHEVSGLPTPRAADAPPDPVTVREARLLVVFVSAVIVYLLGQEDGGTALA